MLLLPISLVPYRPGLIVEQLLYLKDPPTGHRSPSSNGYCGHAVSHRKTWCVFFKPWRSNLSQFFRIQFKGVRLELLAPICKRKKATSAIFLPEASLPALDGGVDRRYTKSFSFLVGLSLSLTNAGTVLVPPGSTTKMGWGCTGVDLMASLLDVQLFTFHLACLCCHPG